MASKDMKELRDKYSKETIDDHQMAVTGGTESNLLKCGKCKQNKCTYNQVGVFLSLFIRLLLRITLEV